MRAHQRITYPSGHGKCLTKGKYEKKFNMKIIKKDNSKPYNKENIFTE